MLFNGFFITINLDLIIYTSLTLSFSQKKIKSLDLKKKSNLFFIQTLQLCVVFGVSLTSRMSPLL